MQLSEKKLKLGELLRQLVSRNDHEPEIIWRKRQYSLRLFFLPACWPKQFAAIRVANAIVRPNWFRRPTSES